MGIKQELEAYRSAARANHATLQAAIQPFRERGPLKFFYRAIPVKAIVEVTAPLGYIAERQLGKSPGDIKAQSEMALAYHRNRQT